MKILRVDLRKEVKIGRDVDRLQLHHGHEYKGPDWPDGVKMSLSLEGDWIYAELAGKDGKLIAAFAVHGSTTERVVFDHENIKAKGK